MTESMAESMTEDRID